MAAYLIQLQARSGWTSIVRELLPIEAGLLITVADELTRNSGFDGAEMSVRPVAECDDDELNEAAWIADEPAERLTTDLNLPDNDEGAADAPAAPSDQNPGRN